MRRPREANFTRALRRSLAKGRMPSIALEDKALMRSSAFHRRGFLLSRGLESISSLLFTH